MKPKKMRQAMLCLAALAIAASVRADVRLPRIFQDHMVLQRERPIPVWGWAAPAEKISVTLDGETATATASRDGRWMVQLAPRREGGPFLLTVEGTNRIVFSDVLIGDVWLCGGQSNMAWKIRQTDFRENDSAFLTTNRVRFFTVDVAMDYVPKDDITGSGWKVLTKENVEDFSAVGYHFGKYLQQELGVPIGLISDNLGATSVETWMSSEALLRFPQFEKEVGPATRSNKSFSELEADFRKGKDRWYRKYYFRGKGIDERWFNPEVDTSAWESINPVGNTWESEPALKDFDGAVWFRTTFDLPANHGDKDFLLQLGQIDDYDIAWVNGEKAGETFGRHNHRNYTIPASSLKPKGNVLVVRVFDAGGIGGFTTNPFWASPVLAGKWKYRKGEPLTSARFPQPQLPNVTPFSSPGVLFNGMIAPLTSFSVKGVIWYQGESNASRAYEYRDLFPAMIRDWRAHWGYEFPFLFVQLANYMKEVPVPGESEWAELREAQASALTLPLTAMATAIDIGEADDIHPSNKHDVGKRLALAALTTAYGRKDVVSSGPAFRKMVAEGEKVRISFDHTGDGLTTRDKYGYIRGFQVAGEDRKFHWAQAYIDGNEVVVFSREVPAPVAVRYAWSDNPGPLDLYNSEGLPALPFRSDTWKGSTAEKVFEDGPRF